MAAVELTKLGSGANLYGYYMFQGGSNPDGKLTTLQESQATGYYNDLWEVGLKRLPSEALSAGFDVEVLPLRKDAPIYLPSQAWPAFPGSGQVSEVRTLSAVPEYEVRIEAAPAKRDSATSHPIEHRQATQPYRNQQNSFSDRGAL